MLRLTLLQQWTNASFGEPSSGDKIWTALMDQSIINDIENVNVGYYFLKEALFKKNKHVFLLATMKQHNMGPLAEMVFGLGTETRMQNLISQEQEVQFMGRYSKTLNLKDRDTCVPAFLCDLLRELLLALLGNGFREALAIKLQSNIGRRHIDSIAYKHLILKGGTYAEVQSTFLERQEKLRYQDEWSW
ncbi:hypothetical protein OG21DRAFT_1525086 [Imleria badia]|nr:hypothetical protein OG21DRAFT_1525086 [Imleria badia]